MTLLMNLETHNKPNPVSGIARKRNVEAELNEIETKKTKTQQTLELVLGDRKHDWQTLGQANQKKDDQNEQNQK